MATLTEFSSVIKGRGLPQETSVLNGRMEGGSIDGEEEKTTTEKCRVK